MMINWYPLHGDAIAFQLDGGNVKCFATRRQAEAALHLLIECERPIDPISLDPDPSSNWSVSVVDDLGEAAAIDLTEWT